MLLLQINLGGSGAPGTASGGNLLGLLFPLNLENPPPQVILVQAVADGTYRGIFHPKGDVFPIFDVTEFSDSSVSIVPPGNPDYPVYGWMQMVPPQPEVDQVESLVSWNRNYIKRTTL